MRRIGLLIASGPAEEDMVLIQPLVRAALAAGKEVSLFLMDAGVGYALDERLHELLQAGAEATVCAMDAEAQGVPVEAIAAAGVRIGSQHDHARLVRDSDRFLSFT